MAISYQTGSYTGQMSLLGTLQAFVTAASNANWSVDYWSGDGYKINDNRLTLYYTPGIRFSFVTSIDNTPSKASLWPSGKSFIELVAHSTLDNMVAVHLQPGSYSDTGDDTQYYELISTPNTVADGGVGTDTRVGNYWFFLDDSYIHIVLEPGQGEGFFQHIFIGQLSLFNGVSFGYYAATSVDQETPGESEWNNADPGHVGHPAGPKIDLNAGPFGHLMKDNGDWVRVNDGQGTEANDSAWTSYALGVSGSPTNRVNQVVWNPIWTTNPANIVPPLFRTQLFAEHSSDTPRKAPMGEVPGCHIIPTDQGFGEAELLVIGSDEYLVFPALRSQRIEVDKYRFLGVAVQKV